MRSLFNLIVAEGRRAWLMWVRYPIQPVVSIAMLFALFAGLHYGFKKFPALGLFSDGGGAEMVAAFFCWIVAMGAIGHTASEIEEEAKLGTLEPVFVSGFRPSTVVLVRSLSASIGGLLVAMLTLASIAWYSDVSLYLGPSTVLALVLLDVGLSGLGMAVAGLCVVLKRVTSIAPILYLGFGLAVAATVSPIPSDSSFHYPVLSSLEVFSRTLFGTQVPIGGVAAACIWSLLTLVVGTLVFERCAALSRARGSLSHR